MVPGDGTRSSLGRARRLIDAGRPGRALAEVEGLGAAAAARDDVVRVKARILVELGLLVDAARLLDRRESPEVQDDEELAVLRARILLGTGTAAEAELASEALTERFPGSWRGWLAHAEVLADTGSPTAARAAVLRAARLAGGELEVAVTALEVEALDVAAGVIREHQRVTPDAEGHFLAALLAMARQDDEAAVDAALDAGHRLDADHPTGHLVTLTRLAVQGDVEGALRAADRMLAGSQVLPVRLLRGALYRTEGRPDEALAEVEQVLVQQPSSSQALLLRAALRSDRGEWMGAVQDASQVLDRRPGDVDARILRGVARLESGHLDLAHRDAATVLATEPRNGEALLLRARISFARAAYADALREVNEAIVVQGETPENLLLRAWVLTKQGGHHGEAMRDVRSVLRIDPGHRLARELVAVDEKVRADSFDTVARGFGRFVRRFLSG